MKIGSHIGYQPIESLVRSTGDYEILNTVALIRPKGCFLSGIIQQFTPGCARGNVTQVYHWRDRTASTKARASRTYKPNGERECARRRRQSGGTA